jgi:hypothetical protein
MVKPSADRPPPKRSPERWAREFVKALKLQTGVSLRLADVTRVAARNKRLRERIPASVVRIVEGSAKAAGLSVGEWVRLAGRHLVDLSRQAKDVRRGLDELKEALGIGDAEARRLVKMQPMLLCYAQGGIARRMAVLRKATGLGAGESRRCAKRSPDVLTIKPATLGAHVRDQRRVLNLSLSDYAKVLMREPRLLMRGTGTIERFLGGMVKEWGIPRKEALALFIKAPKLGISGLAGTMNNNLGVLARGLGCEKAELVKAVKSFPMLAYQKPERLLRAIQAGSAAVGVNKKVLAKAVLRSPSLLARRMEGWSPRMRLVKRIARALGVEATAEYVLTVFPAAMTYGWERLLQRYAMARLGLATKNWCLMLTLPDAKARERLRGYFSEHPDREGLRRALARRSLV